MTTITDPHTAPRPRAIAATVARTLAYVVGAALLVCIFYVFGSATVWLDLQSIGWRLVLIIAIEVLVSGLTAVAWWYTLPRQLRRDALPRVFLVQLAGSAVSDNAPAGPLYGEPMKVLLLHRAFPPAVTTASLLSSKLAQAVGRALFVILGMLAASRLLTVDQLPIRSLIIGFVVTAAGVAMFLVLQIRGLSGPARRASARLHFLGSWVQRLEQAAGRVDEHLQELYRERPVDFVLAVLLVLSGLGLGVVQIWLMLGWIGLQRDWGASLAIEAFSVLVSFVSFVIPGALGVQEGGKLLIFAALGLPVSAGLSVGVAFRLNNLANMAIGLAVLAWLRPLQGVARRS